MKPVIDMPPGAADWIRAVTEFARLNNNGYGTLNEILWCLQELELQHQLGHSTACAEWMQKNQLLFLNWIPCSPEQLGIDSTKELSELAVEVFCRPFFRRELHED
mgnify:CR=1 FL=1|tara:strand:+ start:205 stop:519 length:315 start_codon:yes stop_codon:yes gene_type:complete